MLGRFEDARCFGFDPDLGVEGNQHESTREYNIPIGDKPSEMVCFEGGPESESKGVTLFPGEHPCSIALAVPPGAWLRNRELQELAQVWNAASLGQLAQVRLIARSDVARLTRPGLAPVRLDRSSSLVEGGRALLPARSARFSRFRQKSARIASLAR